MPEETNDHALKLVRQRIAQGERAIHDHRQTGEVDVMYVSAVEMCLACLREIEDGIVTHGGAAAKIVPFPQRPAPNMPATP